MLDPALAAEFERGLRTPLEFRCHIASLLRSQPQIIAADIVARSIHELGCWARRGQSAFFLRTEGDSLQTALGKLGLEVFILAMPSVIATRAAHQAGADEGGAQGSGAVAGHSSMIA